MVVHLSFATIVIVLLMMIIAGLIIGVAMVRPR
jgi:hypothetical protein